MIAQHRTSKSVFTKVAFCATLLLLGGGAWYLMRPAPIEEPPVTVLPNPNAYTFYLKAGQMHEALLAKSPSASAVDAITDRRVTSNLSAAQLARIYPTANKDAWIEANKAVLQELRKGFAYPYFQPPQRSAAGPDPYIGNLRKLARLLIIESHTKSERGDWKGATQSALDALRMGQDSAHGGGLMAALVSYAVQAIACRELGRILPHLDAISSRETALKIESLKTKQTPFSDTLREEKWIGLSDMRALLQSSKAPAFLLSLQPYKGRPLLAKEFFRNLTRGDVVRNYSHYMDALAEQSTRPYALRKLPPDPFKSSLLSIYIDLYERAQWNTARMDTAVSQLRLRMALRAYQLDNGKYPSTLREMVPSYIKEIPPDAYGSGEEMRYRITGKNYMLYSIGPDKIDNGGRPLLAPQTSPPSTLYSRRLTRPDSLGDVVAGINR